jgi:16S rRNA (adenine1518-N6/adenine1519-N6)-dimethyltransferase
MGGDSLLVKSYAPNAKKRFGQHFLRDTGVIDRIVRWTEPSENDLLIEIGAGEGALTSRLAPKAFHLLAVEIDPDRYEALESVLASFPSAELVKGDFLQLDLDELISQHLAPRINLRIVGNLPYNIATPIIEKLLHSSLPILDMHFMVQLEVAQRIAAESGTRQYGYFSVLCQHFAEVRMGFKVSSACFVPRPQVMSSTIALYPKLEKGDPDYQSAFESLGKAAFAYRRKKLVNSLVRDPAFGEKTYALLELAGIDGSRRAEELSVEEFEHLTEIYQRVKSEE